MTKTTFAHGQLKSLIDRHIRDLEMFKAWVKDSAMVRSVSLAGMLGGDTTAPVASPPQQDEAA